MTTLKSNKKKARELMEKVSLAECETIVAYMLMGDIIRALTFDGENGLVEILLNDVEKDIENIKTKHKEKEAEREKFLAGVDEYLQREGK